MAWKYLIKNSYWLESAVTQSVHKRHSSVSVRIERDTDKHLILLEICDNLWTFLNALYLKIFLYSFVTYAKLNFEEIF